MDKYLEELIKKTEKECQMLERVFDEASTFECASDTIFNAMKVQFKIEMNEYEKLWLRKKAESLKTLEKYFEKTINEIQVKIDEKILDCENKTYNNVEDMVYPRLQREDFPDKVKMKEIEEFFVEMNKKMKEIAQRTIDGNENIPSFTFSKNKFLNEIKDGIIPKIQVKDEKNTVVRYTREQIIYCTISQILLNICTIEEKDEFLKMCIKRKEINIYDVYCSLIEQIHFQYYQTREALEKNGISESTLENITEWNSLSRLHVRMYGLVLGSKIAVGNIINKAKKLMEG